MKSVDRASARRGSILPIIAVSLIVLCGFVALAVDIGMVAVAKNQAQSAADLAAFAGARTLDGSTTSNTSAATTNAVSSATANTILSTPISSSNVTVQLGAYHYDTNSQTFYPQYPPVAPETYNLAQVTIASPNSTTFAQVLGLVSTNVTATAVAAHRPRDVSIVLDFSGSMNDESDLWNKIGPAYTYLGSADNSPNNADSVFPTFGAYSATTAANLQCTSTDPRVGMCNISASAIGFPAIVNDFYQHVRGQTPVQAFSAAPASYGTTPGGDNYLHVNNQSTNAYAKTVQDVNNGSASVNSNFETKGYRQFTGKTFNGYTIGPGYWGKTFFIWPPDPTNDWRGKFFMNTGGSYPTFGGPVTDNTKLFDSNGNWRTPPGNYVINYKAILSWLTSTGTNPFPTLLRGGRIQYYNTIPTDVPSSAYDHTQPNSSITDPNQRFWKEYIDYALGVWRDPYCSVNPNGCVHNPTPSSQDSACCIAPDFTWGTVSITTKPSGQYMSYTDNPLRPGQRFWFGPMTMVQYMSDTSLLPGNAHDISMYPAKLGIAGAIGDIQENHPADMISLILYNRPGYANDSSGTGAFKQALFNLSRNYSGMINALWFPPNSSVNDVLPWDANGTQTPRAGDDYMFNTAIGYGMMLAYNQFSASSTLQTQAVGGFGRKGAQRIVILETDGMANIDSIPVSGFANNGANQSYYHILPGETVNLDWNHIGSSYNSLNLLQTVQAICNTSSGTAGTSPGYSPNPGYPGFASANKPVLVHTIAFGAMFESASAGANQTAAVSLLQQISSIGGTTFPSSSSDAANGYKWCIGSASQRATKLRQAFTNVMDAGVAVTLVQ